MLLLFYLHSLILPVWVLLKILPSKINIEGLERENTAGKAVSLHTADLGFT